MASSIQYPLGFSETGHRRAPICGILACSIAAGTSLDYTMEWFRNYREYRKNWKGRTWAEDYFIFLGREGIKYAYHDFMLDHKRNFKLPTAARFATQMAVPGMMYMLLCRGHVMTCKDGMICDQGGNKAANLHRCKKLRVQAVIEIQL